MACYLQLMQGGHLNLVSTSGSLLLNVCNDAISVPIPDNRYSWELTREVLKRRKDEYDALEQEKRDNELLAKQKEEEVERIEAKRLSDLSDEFLQAQLLRNLRQLEEIRLQQELINQRILMFMRDEEDIFIILSSLPFVA